MTPVEVLLSKLPSAKKAGSGWAARCPAHEDRKASLSVSAGEDGTALVKCHAGCDTSVVLAAVELTMSDLFPTRSNPTPSFNGKAHKPSGKTFPTANKAVAELERQHGKRSALWTYHDIRGQSVGVVVRWDRPEGKDIRPVARHGDGWRIAAMPDPRPLYGLPELASAQRVVVVEGEKAADAAQAIGFTATTSAGGSGAPNKTDWRPLARKEVWILPDNDASGRKYADTVAATLAKLTPAPVVRIVVLPDLPDSGDLVDWIDAHGDAAEPEELRRQIEVLASQVKPLSAGAPDDDSGRWPDPLPLAPAMEVPPFPVDVLTPWLRDYVLALSEEKQVPVDLAATLALGAVAAGIARKVVVSPWAGWEYEPVNIYVMCCLPPGERKSQTFSAVFAPVKAHEAERRLTEEPAILEAESLQRTAQKRVEHLEGKVAKEDDPEKRSAFKESLKAAREELLAIDVPARAVLRVDDDTPAMLALELVKQKGRLLAASPEAKTLENVSLYSDSPDMDVFLKGHAGDDIRTGRISRGRDSVDRPALTCAYSPQPCVLEQLGATPQMRGRGFLARWFYALPVSVVGFRRVRTVAIPHNVRAAYEAALLRLWTINYREPKEGMPFELVFTPESRDTLAQFEQWKEGLLRPGAKLSAVGGWGNKLGGLCVRLCGILHAADGILAGGDWLTSPIRPEVVQRAARLCREYAVPHALAAFGVMGSSSSMVGAKAVLKWMRGRPDPLTGFSKRDAFNGCRGTFETVDELQPALDLLERHYLIRTAEEKQLRNGPGRKPSPLYDVNPAGAQFTHNTHNASESQPGGNSAESAESARGIDAEVEPADSHYGFNGDRLFPDQHGLPD